MGHEELKDPDQDNRDGLNKNKRVRDDKSEHNTVPDSPGPKLARVDSPGSDRVDSVNSGLNSPEARRIQENLLSSIPDGRDDATLQGLESVMRSFEEEILVGAPAPDKEFPPEVGLSAPELGFLLEPSNDDFGLPPAVTSVEEAAGVVDFEAGAVGGGFGFVEEIPGYDSFDFGLIVESEVNGGDEFVAVGGLFDLSDDSFGTEADASLST